MNGFKDGEVRAAADVLRNRLDAVMDGPTVMEVNVETGEMRGDHLRIRGVYGDLVDVTEVADVSQAPVNRFIYDIASGIEPDVALRSLYLLAVAHGVLIERARRSA